MRFRIDAAGSLEYIYSSEGLEYRVLERLDGGMLEGPRSARIEELREVVKLVSWVFSFDKYGISIDRIFPHVFCESNIDNLRIIVCDGKVVSHLAIWEGLLYFYGIQLKIGLIGCVCTHPDYRMRGYASMLVSDAFTKLRRDDVDLVMVSGARMLYSRVGCVESGILYDYVIPADRAELFKDRIGGVEIEEYRGDDALDLVELYQREPIRFRRSYDEFKLLVDRIFTVSVEAKGYASIYLSYKMGRVISYVVLLRWPGSSLATVIEYAGSRTGILSMLYDTARMHGVDRIRLQIPYGEWDLVASLESYGLKPEASYAPASFAILNPPVFIEKIKPYIEERIGVGLDFKVSPRDGYIELYASGESMKLKDSRMLTALVFGRPSIIRNLDDDDIAIDMDRIPRIFRRVFPLPSIRYGLNYI
jgi:GNAT superfamily N-acetyltransferase